MDDQAFLEELKKDFFDEANSLIQIFEDNILVLEKEQDNIEAINEIFRVVHTLKGGAASLELDRIAAFTHEMENLLDEIRNGKIKMEPLVFDTIFQAIDICKEFINLAMETLEPEPGFEDNILNNVKHIIENYLIKEGEKPAVKAETITPQPKETITQPEPGGAKRIDYALTEYDKEFISKAKDSDNTIYDIYIKLNPDNPMKTVSGLQIYSILKEFGDIIKCNPDIDDLLDDKFSEEIGFLFSSSVSVEFIKNKINISDVITKLTISEFEEEFEGSATQTEETLDISVNISEKNEIIDYINQGNNVFQISVIFDDSNPMRSVSGVLFYSMLEGIGNVLKSTPTLEQFKEDIFYDKGLFILITGHDTEYVKEKLYISDITKELKILKYKEKEGEAPTKQTEAPEIKKDIQQEKTVTPPKEKVEDKTTQPVTAIQVEDSITKKVEDTPPVKTVEKTAPPTPTTTPIKKVEQKTPFKQAKPKPSATSVTKSSILRVESKRVDDLLNLVGELVISKAGLFQINDKNTFMLDDLLSTISKLKKDIKHINTTLTSPDLDLNKEENKLQFSEKVASLQTSLEKISPGFRQVQDMLRNTTQSFGRLTNELHESVMKLRMVPINQIFNRFPRLVRDLSKTLNKEINLITRGEETELDKSLIEDLIDPLIHIVRNAVDHGIEEPAAREKKGKPRQGTLILEAEHEGQMISIRIKDDGNGLHKDKIKKKAIERGIIDAKTDLPDSEIFSLIFQPGFSTTEAISQVSGRGVGMDVVKQKVGSLNGTISIETEPGKGTSFIIKLPLTLAIIQALMVNVANLTYSLPINSVIETIRISPQEIEFLENNEIIRVREEVMSLIHLKEIFNHGHRGQAEYFYVIIVGTSDTKIGLVVDSLIGEQDVVIKPLSSKLAAADGIAGAAILGDGTVSLIIDIPQLIKTIKDRRQI